MIDILLQIGLIVLAIVILVTVHELGHFWAARMFGIKVETFSIFFPPKIWGFKWGETEWQIGSIPLGGFVKISGMIDESLDQEQLDKPIEPWEFRAKPVWQRAIVMLGGIIMNILLGFLIFIGLKFFAGDDKISNDKLRHGIIVDKGSAGEMLGFKTGDKLITYCGDTVRYFDQFLDPNWLIDRNKVFEVERGGQIVKIEIANDYMRIYQNLDDKKRALFSINGPAEILVVDSMRADEKSPVIATPAKAAGLDSGDVIVRIDSTPIPLFSDLKTYVKSHKGQEIKVVALRNKEEKEFTVKVDTAGVIGVEINRFLYVHHVDYTFTQSLAAGPAEAMLTVSRTLKGLWAVIVGNSDRGKSLSSFVKISKFYKIGFDRGGWVNFWLLTGMLSMVLAVMNLLPIPALDGGHVMFLAYEAITGREPSLKFRMIAQQVGMILLLGLMAFIIIKDIITY